MIMADDNEDDDNNNDTNAQYKARMACTLWLNK